jgi:zinc D-Ala-D-Ala dipeptidase
VDHTGGIKVKRNLKPIPILKEPGSWQSVAIVDNNEPLMSIHDLQTPKVSSKPMYLMNGLPGALNDCYVRREVGERLIKAADLLPQSFSLLVWDGFRPFQVQESLYNQFYQRIKQENSTLLDLEIQAKVKRFVSIPSLNKKAPSPHLTGGAVDLTIVDEQHTPLPMGTAFDDFSKKAGTRYFEEQLEADQKLTQEERKMLENRRLLYYVMKEAGFTSYIHEWWHFDYGNQWWATLSNKNTATYGIANLNDEV